MCAYISRPTSTVLIEQDAILPCFSTMQMGDDDMEIDLLNEAFE
jgi:hypothetical protein